MKKALLFLMLFPALVFSQTDISTWNNLGGPATVSNISGLPIQSSNMQIQHNDSGQNNNNSGFRVNNTSNTLNYSSYLQFQVTVGAGYKLTPSAFKLTYRSPNGNNGMTAMEVRYSTSSTFTSNGTSLGTQTLDSGNASSNNLISYNFTSGTVFTAGTTVYIRVYAYGQGNCCYGDLYIRNTTYNTSINGPVLTGTVSNENGVQAAADAATTLEGMAVTIPVTNNDTATGTTINSLSIFAPSANGTATVSGNNIIFTPNSSYTGTTTFQYTLHGADGTTSNATVTVTVNPFTPPTANADTATTGQNIPVTVSVLSNDTAGDGIINALTITGAPANGTAVVNGNNTITYTPNSTFTGTNTITYKITDSNNKTATTTVTVTVQAIVPADAVNDSASTAKNTAISLNVLSNDSAGNSAITTVVIASAPSHGSAVVNADKTITYTPTTGYTGTDSFTYTITNAYNTSDTATVSMSVLQPTTGDPLCGTYYIGTGGDFTTITSAVNYLNTYGVQCPVTFLLNNTLFNNDSGETFPITINSINTTAVNTVTFKPAPYKNVTVQGTNINDYTGVPAIFCLKGADYVTFDGSNTSGGTSRNFTLRNDGNVSYIQRSVIWIASNGSNGATNTTVKNMNIKLAYKNSQGNFCTGIYSGNYGIEGNNSMVVEEATANNSNIYVKNNDFMNVKQGIYINGGTSTLTTNVTVLQNDLGSENNTETIIQPAYFKNVNIFTYQENYVYNLYRDTNAGSLRSAGIHVAGNSSNGNVVRNSMKDLTRTTTDSQTFAGVILESTNTNSNILVANNFILNVAAQGNGDGALNGHGIVIVSGGGYKIYNNTVKLKTNQASTGRSYSACLYVCAGVTNLDVRNNIFLNQQTNTATERFAIAVVGAGASTFSNLNYNNLYSTKFIGTYGPTITDGGNPYAQTTLSGWKTTTGKEVNSVSILPTFVSENDLHLDQYASANTAFNNLGTNALIATVSRDIDGQVRNTSTPDIGADEFGPLELPTPGTGTGIYCDSSTTWNGTDWSNGEPASDLDVIFAADYTQTGGTLNACSLWVIEGAEVNFTNNANAIVVHSVNVDDDTEASLTFESGSNLVQTENDENAGNVTVKRNGSMLYRLDYTGWSSPVHGTQTLLDFSPNTLTNRFYMYSAADNSYINDGIDPAATTFTPGAGYLIRMPNGYPANGATAGYNEGLTQVSFKGAFEGTPNNGTIRVPLQYVDDSHAYNLVGNPYSSPINIRDFIVENSDVIDGTIWIWRKKNNPNVSTYWTINLTGAIMNSAANGGNNDLTPSLANFNSYANSILNTGQGFLVKATSDDDLVFTNGMRQSVNLNTFFRTADTDNGPVANQYGRYWLNINGTDDAFAQTMVSYSENGTLGYDNGYDGKTLLDGGTKLFTLAYQDEETFKLAIQSRSAFTIGDVVPMGFGTEAGGEFEISLDNVDGIFSSGQQIYVVDALTGITHNLNEGVYNFTCEPGLFTDRFQVIYTTESLGTNNPVIDAQEVIVYRTGKQVNIESPRDIQSVYVYDILGRTLYQNTNVASASFTSSEINTAQQVVIVRATLDNGQVVTKKIMMN